jgi:hypothetical protein
MHRLAQVLAAVVALLAPASVRAGGPAADLGITFTLESGIPGGTTSEALLDAGPVSAAWNRQPHARIASPFVERRVGVRITSRSGRRGFVRLRAFLETADARAIVSVDGMALSSAPRLVDAQAPIGSTASHRLTVEVPASEPAGAFTSRIVWEVEEP